MWSLQWQAIEETCLNCNCWWLSAKCIDSQWLFITHWPLGDVKKKITRVFSRSFYELILPERMSTHSDWYILHQTRSSLAQIMSGLLQGLPFLKIITCPTSRILKCFDLLTWNKEKKSVQIHMPGSFTCPGPSGSGKRQSLACKQLSLLCPVTMKITGSWTAAG